MGVVIIFERLEGVLGRNASRLMVVIVPLILVAAMSSGLASAASPSLTLHYKQTVVFEGPNGAIEVSGVFSEVARYSGPILATPRHMESYVVGEALGADVPDIGYVVQSLVRRSLDGAVSGTIISNACGVPPPEVRSPDQAAAWFDEVGRAFASRCELPIEYSQIVVMFTDPINHPETGVAYFPGHLPNGLHIRSIHVEPTAEPPSYGRLTKLPWLQRPRHGIPVLRLTPDVGRIFELATSYFVMEE